MEVGLFVLGVLVGVGLTWYLLERYRRDETAEREAHFNARVAGAAERDPRIRRRRLAETKDRLIALQMEHRAADARAKPLEAELAQAKRAAEQAIEQEMRQRELNAAAPGRAGGAQAWQPGRHGRASRGQAGGAAHRRASRHRSRRRPAPTISP